MPTDISSSLADGMTTAASTTADVAESLDIVEGRRDADENAYVQTIADESEMFDRVAVLADGDDGDDESQGRPDQNGDQTEIDSSVETSSATLDSSVAEQRPTTRRRDRRRTRPARRKRAQQIDDASIDTDPSDIDDDRSDETENERPTRRRRRRRRKRVEPTFDDPSQREDTETDSIQQQIASAASAEVVSLGVDDGIGDVMSDLVIPVVEDRDDDVEMMDSSVTSDVTPPPSSSGMGDDDDEDQLVALPIAQSSSIVDSLTPYDDVSADDSAMTDGELSTPSSSSSSPPPIKMFVCTSHPTLNRILDPDGCVTLVAARDVKSAQRHLADRLLESVDSQDPEYGRFLNYALGVGDHVDADVWSIVDTDRPYFWMANYDDRPTSAGQDDDVDSTTTFQTYYTPVRRWLTYYGTPRRCATFITAPSASDALSQLRCYLVGQGFSNIVHHYIDRDPRPDQILVPLSMSALKDGQVLFVNPPADRYQRGRRRRR